MPRPSRRSPSSRPASSRRATTRSWSTQAHHPRRDARDRPADDLPRHRRHPFGTTAAGFSAEIQINRKDFGLTWNVALESGGVLVSENVKISLDIQAVKQ
jgi:hypothetical protein